MATHALRVRTTDDARPIIAGSNAIPGDTISVFDNGVFIGAGVVDINGNWRFTPTNMLANGPHTFTATETSSRTGLTGLPSDGVSVVISSSSTPVAPEAPAAPTIIGALDAVGAIQGNIANGGQTDDTQPAFLGTGHAGDIVKLYDGSHLIGSTIAGSDGRWMIKPSAPLGQGSHTIHATDTNAAGVVSAFSSDYVVTISAGTAQTPAITSVYDHVGNHTGNIASGGQTDDTHPTISGTGHAGDVINVLDAGTPLGVTTVDSNGNWSFTPSYPLANGNHYIVAVASSAGQPASAPSAPVTFTVQPDKRTIDFLVDAAGPVQGNVENGGTGDDSNATLKGHGTPGDMISCYVNGTLVNGVRVESDGTYTIHLKDLNPGNLTITTRSSSGASSDPFVYHLQSSATDVPTIDYLVDAVGAVQGNVSSGGVTDDVNGVLKGHSQAGDVLKIYDGVTLLGAVQVSNAGEWSFQLNNMASGTHSFHAVSFKGGAESATFPVTFGTPAAGAPTIDAIVDHAGPVTGNIAPGGATDDTPSHPLRQGRPRRRHRHCLRQRHGDRLGHRQGRRHLELHAGQSARRRFAQPHCHRDESVDRRDQSGFDRRFDQRRYGGSERSAFDPGRRSRGLDSRCDRSRFHHRRFPGAVPRQRRRSGQYRQGLRQRYAGRLDYRRRQRQLEFRTRPSDGQRRARHHLHRDQVEHRRVQRNVGRVPLHRRNSGASVCARHG
ncbi:hemolysin-type calcium-binding region [Caballeronia choica]|uniref:Hemolysin-type calcium-binding region n=1 Tax=Caballeronia choica TaxID=326476 RepID=A0A158FJM7_9BURK|nr:Ig-like domain-containing protein [Caballeronia choica]SAL20088.1 hemolysin-type calcium-binding region [Caballeronia choica]